MAGRSGEASAGYCYLEASSTINENMVPTNFQSFHPSPEMYNFTAAVDMNILGFPPKNLHQETSSPLWKGFFAKPADHRHRDSRSVAAVASPSMEVSEPTSSHEFYHDFNNRKLDVNAISGSTTNETTLLVSPDSSSAAWNQQDRLIPDDPSLPCVFTCEGNERPSQGLSLSLSSSNPPCIGLQSFELRQHHDLSDMQGYSHVKNSRYLGPAQELLDEFCNLGINQNVGVLKVKADDVEDDETRYKRQTLYSMEVVELQRRKAKLLQMLDEVDRRYKHYCDQMKGVTSSFEAVVGEGAARVYSALASRAMSRHFRSLRDGIVREMKAVKKAMGEKGVASLGSVKGETPRLRLLDQTLRQHKALQQMTIMENHPWRPQRGLPERSVSLLRAWLFEHFLHPYPSDVDKHILARQTGLSRSQVSNWFINARVRLWKPMVEEMYLEEQKEEGQEKEVLQNQNPCRNDDEKPRLAGIDSECLSSIINNNNPDKNEARKIKTTTLEQHHKYNLRVGVGDSYEGAMELDFSSGVSLTLGLHQHEEVNMAFSTQSSVLYPRDQMEECQTVQYSVVENQNLQYRNLMGSERSCCMIWLDDPDP